MNIWRHSWEEIQDALKEGKKLKSINGLPLNGTDDFQLWSGSVRVAHEQGKRVPKYVLDEFYNTEGFGLTPKRRSVIKKEKKMVVNRKGKPFSWSYSAINDFQTCPLKYAEARFYCTTPFEDSEALRWGNKVHTALENRLKKGTPLPGDMAEYEKYALAALNSGGDVKAEMEIAVDRDWKPVSWFAKDAWGRCKIDVIIDKGEKVAVWDWKTGKVKDNDLQLDISALFASMVMPKAAIFVPKFIFLAHGVVTPKDKVIQKSDLVHIKSRVEEYVKQMEEAWETEVFECRPSGLCRNWCAVMSCEHNGRR